MKNPNEKRPGYKKTKVGWIPKEWDALRISELAEVSYGLTVNEIRRNSSRRRPYLTVANFSCERLKLDEVKQIGCSESDERRYTLKTGDILVVEGNGSRDIVGTAALWRGEIPGALHQNHLLRIRPRPQQFESDLLVRFINSGDFRRRLQPLIITSSGLNTINSETLGSALVPVPPPMERGGISQILSVCDSTVYQTRDLLDAKKAQKKALMQQLLTGKRRLSGFKGKWECFRLSQICTRLREVTENPGDYPVLSITAGTGFVSQEDKFSRVIAGKQVENYVLLKHGEFAYNKGNSYRFPQGCVYQLTEYKKGLVPDVFYSFKLDEEQATPEFIKQYFLAGLHNKDLYRWINSGVRNNGLLNLSATDFFNLPIHLPGMSEQKEIGEVMKAADDEIKVLGSKLAALKEQKKGLMQKLLTGQIRVKV